MPRHPERHIERLAQPEAARLLATTGVAVVATGSVEQHGGHLPLGTDAFAALSIAERGADRLDTAVIQPGPLGWAAPGGVGQHGGHLPRGTDAFAALSIAERVADRLDTAVIQLGPVGVAHYHLPWQGALPARAPPHDPP